ncbi:MAG: ABC transporter permease [Ilumatobacteraceae bacterium]|jgi:osmoprotectant transport system permease protein|nr:ABC transporter permease [Actinomycetota bacterium]MDA3016262.1 ABC transporter permease [Actinomycetota bacterium]MDA3025491.1 ABC transporter permease [Actinomycetota bacterium]NBU56571.1 ABC transporter permease [Acidimicrobiia bacterium]
MSGITNWFEYVGDRWSDVWGASWDHLMLVIQVMIVATVLSVAVGVAVRNNATLRNIALGVAGILITIPSLALFTIFIPIVGLGFKPAFIALLLYAILPILRNTITGLREVDPNVLESARGMGLNGTQRLIRVQLPLAWPVILAGIRVSTLITTGFAAIATLVAGPGLGIFIKDGLRRLGLPLSMESVWTGTIFTILLALALDLVLSTIGRFTTSRGVR